MRASRCVGAVLWLLPVLGGSLRAGRKSDVLDQGVGKLWAGLDLTDQEHALLAPASPPHRVGQLHAGLPLRLGSFPWPNASRPLNMALLGPFNSGTNLLHIMLRSNYGLRFSEACRSPFDAFLFSAQCSVWKHGLHVSGAPTPDLQPFHSRPTLTFHAMLKRKGLSPADTVLVMLVRSPLSQLLSWQKSPYDLWRCVDRNWSKWGQACRAGLNWRHDGDYLPGDDVDFSSTLDVYNRYLRMYRQLQADVALHRALLITYEDLVLSPDSVITQIGDALGWPRPARVQIMETPAKWHGKPSGREHALESIKGRAWLSAIPVAAQKFWCSLLDLDAMAGIDENTHGVRGYSNVPYGFDCQGVMG